MATKKLHEVEIYAAGKHTPINLATLKLQTIQKWLRSNPVPGQYLVVQTLKQDQDQEKDDGIHRRLKFLVVDCTGRYRETWFVYGPKTRPTDKQIIRDFLGLTDDTIQNARVRMSALDMLVGYVVTGTETSNDTVRLKPLPPVLFDPERSTTDTNNDPDKSGNEVLNEIRESQRRHKKQGRRISSEQRKANYEYAQHESAEKRRKIQII
ncbi:hypothetical protein [Burkholderia cenocepacia]|uniref:hypothetical protein n=1 Tax=Burkholderia cenocepacia TaxID=95486 RepID=UPI0028635AAF|nr:hypothetical protein [Burkholderia cenocepacia]MDR8054231.1 hypothetical protein [Burkholderia cenocepacia]MDR8064674.1 hypothetical protein [Burkholderia cenocepacia]